MEKFTTWKAIAVPFDQANIDTNQLCPTRFNKVEKGPKYAEVLFHDLRFDAGGREQADPFDVNPLRKRCLLNGLDDFSLTAEFRDAIEQFETAYRREVTWLCPDGGSVETGKP